MATLKFAYFFKNKGVVCCKNNRGASIIGDVFISYDS
jgi:hypothetical protein